jgi:hypothetical protein
MSHRSSRYLAFSAVAIALAFAVPAHAADESPNVRVRVAGAEGEHFSLDLSSGFLTGLVKTALAAGIHCDTTLDADASAMLHHLDREGEGSRYTLVEDSGKRIKARRHSGQLDLEVTEVDGRTSRVSIPWAFADCALGRRMDAGDLFDGDGGLEIKIDGEDGSKVRVKID